NRRLHTSGSGQRRRLHAYGFSFLRLGWHSSSDERVALAAVYRDARARDQAGAFGAQEGDHVAHLLSSAEATERHILLHESAHGFGVLLLAAPPAATGERDRAGRNRQHSNVVGR